jgi:hypothetical protein
MLFVKAAGSYARAVIAESRFRGSVVSWTKIYPVSSVKQLVKTIVNQLNYSIAHTTRASSYKNIIKVAKTRSIEEQGQAQR